MKMRLVSVILASSIATESVAQAQGQWRSVDADQTSAVFFDQKSLQQVGPGAGRATFAIAWKEPDDAIYPNFRIKNVSVVEEVWQSACKAGTITLQRRTYYSDGGDQLQEVRASTLIARVPKPASLGVEFLNLLCGRPQLLGATFEVGPAGLVRVARQTRVEPKTGDAASR